MYSNCYIYRFWSNTDNYIVITIPKNWVESLWVQIHAKGQQSFLLLNNKEFRFFLIGLNSIFSTVTSEWVHLAWGTFGFVSIFVYCLFDVSTLSNQRRDFISSRPIKLQKRSNISKISTFQNFTKFQFFLKLYIFFLLKFKIFNGQWLINLGRWPRSINHSPGPHSHEYTSLKVNSCIILTGPDQYNVFFRILSELVFCLRYTITKSCRLTDLHV